MNFALIRYIRKLFYYKIDNKVLHLQALLHTFPSFADSLNNLIECIRKITHYDNVCVYEIKKEDTALIGLWCELINSSYGDCEYSLDSAKKLLFDHLYLVDNHVFLVVECGNGKEPVALASVSCGLYRENKKVGGAYRLAVSNELKNKGIGKLLMILPLSYLKEQGIKLAESIIASKRIQSCFVHFELGFFPQLNAKYFSYKGALKNINTLQSLRLKFRALNYYWKYLKKKNSLFKNFD